MLIMYAQEIVAEKVRECIELVQQLKSFEEDYCAKTGSFPNFVLNEEYRSIFQATCIANALLVQKITADTDLTLPFEKYGLQVLIDNSGPAACVSSEGVIRINLQFFYKLYLAEVLSFFPDIMASSQRYEVFSKDILVNTVGLSEDIVEKASYLLKLESALASTDENVQRVVFFRFFGIVNFLICHELSHFVCGHCGVIRDADMYYSVSNEQIELKPPEWSTEVARSWAREFCCDMYATTRGMLNSRTLSHVLEDDRPYEHVMNGGTVVIANLSHGIFEVYKNHPSAFSRLIAHLAAIVNCVSPVSNAVTGFRPSYIPWKIDYGEDGYGVLDKRAWILLSETYDTAIYSLSVLNDRDLSSLSQDSMKKSINLCASMWRIGFGNRKEDIEENFDNPFINSLISGACFEFYSGMHDLCTVYNGFYASEFPIGLNGGLTFDDCRNYCEVVLGCEGKDFLTKELSGSQRLVDALEKAYLSTYVVDPAYQALDSIFSNIQAMSEPDRVRVEGLTRQEEFERLSTFADTLVKLGNSKK